MLFVSSCATYQEKYPKVSEPTKKTNKAIEALKKEMDELKNESSMDDIETPEVYTVTEDKEYVENEEPSILIKEGFKNLNELNLEITITGLSSIDSTEEGQKYNEKEIKSFIFKELNYRIPILEVNESSENKLHLDVNIVNQTASVKMEFMRNVLGTVWRDSNAIYKRFYLTSDDIEKVINAMMDEFVGFYINAGNSLVPSNKDLKCPKDLLLNIDTLFDKMRNKDLYHVMLIDLSCKEQDDGIELIIDYKTDCQSRSWAQGYIMASAWNVFHDLFTNPQIIKIPLNAYVITIDEYGQEHLELGAKIKMDRIIYSKINWENMSIGMLENLLVKNGYWKWLPAMEKIRGF